NSECPTFDCLRLDPSFNAFDLVVDPVTFPVDLFRVPGKQLPLFLGNQSVGRPDAFRFKNVAVAENEGEVLIESLLAKRSLEGECPQGRAQTSQRALPRQPGRAQDLFRAMDPSRRPRQPLLAAS